MKVGLVICTFNRPAYLKRLLDSLRRADLSKLNYICIVDDASTDIQTKILINYFWVPNVAIYKISKPQRMSIKDSLLKGYDHLFYEAGCDIAMNLDGDAIVRNDFLNVLVGMKMKFKGNIVTGFNCNTKNRDGSVRHQILTDGETYNTKATVGGVNFVLHKEQYDRFMRPALQQTLMHGGNFDQLTCLNAMEYRLHTICVKPSVVQHIGIESSMGHSAGGEPPDVADDFKLLNLPHVTLVGADCVNLPGLIKAANISEQDIFFKKTVLLSSQPSEDKRVIQIDRIGSKEAYSRFIVKELHKYVDSLYCLVIQSDGYVLNAEAWTDEFYQYDYIGAPWEWYEDCKVGNGGFSLRSQRLNKILATDDAINLVNDRYISNFAEDHNICRIYRCYLEEKYHIRFAPEEIARRFSIEAFRVAPPDNHYAGSFGFHGKSVRFVGRHVNMDIFNKIKL